MIARWLRPASLGALLAALVAFALSVAACDKVPLTAPTESTISLFATASSISATGSTDIVATVIESAGTPVQNGTVVTFTTTLGRIEPVDARTQNGKVTVKLTGDGRSGTATITAFSGGAIERAVDAADWLGCCRDGDRARGTWPAPAWRRLHARSSPSCAMRPATP